MTQKGLIIRTFVRIIIRFWDADHKQQWTKTVGCLCFCFFVRALSASEGAAFSLFQLLRRLRLNHGWLLSDVSLNQ